MFASLETARNNDFPRDLFRRVRNDTGDARADQGLVDDDSQGEAHQDRREGRQAWPLRRLQMAEVAANHGRGASFDEFRSGTSRDSSNLD
jgi:hypothetical protein